MTIKRITLIIFLCFVFAVAPQSAFCADGDPVLLPLDIDLAVVPTSDHSIGVGSPHTNDIAAGESVTIMDCVYMGTDGEWHKTDADAIASGGGLLAISLESKNDGEAMNVALPGSFVRDDTWNWSLTTEQGRVYLDTETAGALTQTPPSGTDDVVRIAGYAVTTDIIYFGPEIVVVHN